MSRSVRVIVTVAICVVLVASCAMCFNTGGLNNLNLGIPGLGTVGSNESGKYATIDPGPVATGPNLIDTPGPVAASAVGEPSKLKVPLAFPRLIEETGLQAYLQTMFNIMTVAHKGVQHHEMAPPTLVRVTGSASCKLKGKPTQTLGDRAKTLKNPSPPAIAVCEKGGKVVIMYAPQTTYRVKLNFNPPVLEQAILETYVTYLAALATKANGNTTDLVTACAAGRTVGGLRDRQYLTFQRANEMYKPDSDEWGTVYTLARDKGVCVPRLVGAKG